MIEMLRTRKEQLEARGEKGFTLMEMLIVIAIIAILIAIAIPIFVNQLNAAKGGTDQANARSLYAQLQANYMLDEANYEAPDGLTSGPDTITYDGTTYEFSDQLTELTIGENATTGGPTVTVKSYNVDSTFGA